MGGFLLTWAEKYMIYKTMKLNNQDTIINETFCLKTLEYMTGRSLFVYIFSICPFDFDAELVRNRTKDLVQINEDFGVYLALIYKWFLSRLWNTKIDFFIT